MPLYEYHCPTCGRFELIRKFSDPPLATCPTCGAEVQKLLSAPAIQFKGAGWYITDYARKGAGEGEKKAGGKSEGSGDGGKEAAKDGGGKTEAASSSSTDTSAKTKPA